MEPTGNSGNPANRDKLMQDMKVVIADAEELLRATASQAGEKIGVARERIQDSLHQAKVKLAEAEAKQKAAEAEAKEGNEGEAGDKGGDAGDKKDAPKP